MKEVQHTSVADQQELIRILSCEIQNKWLKALGMPPVPAFTLSQNNEVLRRMALGTILICENIFKVSRNKQKSCGHARKADIVLFCFQQGELPTDGRTNESEMRTHLDIFS